ncbi:sigma-70 family RNA polymerase sigma factor [Sedimentibacter sp.]|uniref:RNA polymerase sigma factor n=1 Tax=Sedimentibacter sp. TaxID=1960295 RepID=UPI00289B11B0|nr:sigma-70 family RNA polymerase sigma factor [Sedimentibacter sp.]
MNLLIANDLYVNHVEKYSDMVTRICYLRFNCLADAEDCWQNVFIKLYNSKEMWQKPDEELRRWLITVTINESRDIHRKLFRRNHFDIDKLVIPYIEKFDRSLLHAVRALPYKYSEVIYLYHYEGYSIKELVEILKRNENTIKSQLKRGREMLKDVIKDE